MRSANFITKTEGGLTLRRKDANTLPLLVAAFEPVFFVSLLVCVLTLNSFAQRVAVLSPDNAELSRTFSAALKNGFSELTSTLDDDLSSAAFGSVGVSDPFNMTADESKRAGAAIGSDFLILLKAVTQRRSAFGRPDYYEAYAPVYLVSSRTGRLIHWQLQTFEAKSQDAASKMLLTSASTLARVLESVMAADMARRLTEPDAPRIEEVPDEGSPAARNFRAPIPYRRIKPAYTTMAALYDISATVEILVDTDTGGEISRTEIVRWAGYGLDGSVEKTVREMNWRPAERNGKPLPMRFLLRYNFKKLPKETDK